MRPSATVSERAGLERAGTGRARSPVQPERRRELVRRGVLIVSWLDIEEPAHVVREEPIELAVTSPRKTGPV